MIDKYGNDLYEPGDEHYTMSIYIKGRMYGPDELRAKVNGVWSRYIRHGRKPWFCLGEE